MDIMEQENDREPAANAAGTDQISDGAAAGDEIDNRSNYSNLTADRGQGTQM